MAYPENNLLIGLFICGVFTVFSQRHLITTMPVELNVLSGSCVDIPCEFNIPQPNSITFNILTYGIWIKSSTEFVNKQPSNVMFNSSNTDNIYPGKLTGNMTQRNCSTVFYNVTTSYTDKYFFRIEHAQYRATDPEKFVNIVVRDIPPKPKMTDSGDLKEGTPVSLNCSAVAPCPEHPPKLTWSLPTKSTPNEQMQKNPDQTKSVVSMVTFTPSYLDNEKSITCTAVYPVGTSNKKAKITGMLNVLFSPKDTSASISASDPVSLGSSVNLTCSSKANPPVRNYTWFRISDGNPTQVSSRQNYTFNVTIGDGGLYYCVATNYVGLGNSSEVRLAIKGQEKILNQKLFGIVGGTMVVVLIFILIALCGWKRKSRLPNGLPHNSLEEGYANQVYDNQVYANQTLTREEPAEDPLEEIQYGEIDFSKQRPKETPAVSRYRDQGQESEYSEVKMTRRGIQYQEPPIDELYSQVN